MKFGKMNRLIILLAVLILPHAVHAEGVTRISGEDRYGTAQQVSEESFTQADTVILASGEQYADALASSSLSQMVKGPILLTPKGKLDDLTRQEIERLKASNILIIGGENTISMEVEQTLRDDYTVSRIAGKDRYETAQRIANYLLENVDATHAYLVDGRNFPDALSAGGLSAIVQWPILFTDNTMPQATKSVLDAHQLGAVVIGGVNSVPEHVVEGLTDDRFYGADRYETSTASAKSLDDARAVILASGTSYPDALVSAALAGVQKAPVLLVGESLDASVRGYLVDNPYLQKVYVVGGERSIPKTVEEEAEKILLEKPENRPPSIQGPNTASIFQNEVGTLWDIFTITDDKDDRERMTLEVIGEDFKATLPGIYKVSIKVTDSQGLSAEKKITLTVLEKTGVNVKDPAAIELAREQMLKLINEDRARLNVQKGLLSSDFNTEELNSYAMEVAQKWAKEKGEVPPKVTTERDVVGLVYHKGFRQANNVYRALYDIDAFKNTLMRSVGIPYKDMTSIVYGIGVAVDDEGNYYWVVATGGRFTETEPELIRHKLKLADTVPQFRMKSPYENPVKIGLMDVVDFCELVEATQPYPVKIIPQSEYKVVQLYKNGNLVPLNSFSTAGPAVYEVVYRVEGYFGEVSKPFTVTIQVGETKPDLPEEPPITEPEVTEPEVTEPEVTEPADPIDPTQP